MGGNRMPTSGRFLYRELTVAEDGVNRRFVPAAMLAIRPRGGVTYGWARLVVGIPFCLRFSLRWRQPSPCVEMVVVKGAVGRDMDV